MSLALCVLPDCTKKSLSRGWCSVHYMRWWKHGNPHTLLNEKHGETGTYLYAIWLNIKNRTTNNKHPNYKHYGGRGIRMQDSWLESFTSFKAYVITHIGKRPSKSHSIDRIDNDIGYCEGNLGWATQSVQMLNQRGKSKKGLPRGVKSNRNSTRYQAFIQFRGNRTYLGTFDTPEQAHTAYLTARKNIIETGAVNV